MNVKINAEKAKAHAITDRGYPMSNLSKVLTIALKQGASDPIKEHLTEDPEGVAVLSKTLDELRRAFGASSGFSKEEAVAELLAESVGKLMSVLAAHTPDEMATDNPLKPVFVSAISVTTVMGLCLKAVIEAHDIPLS